MDQIKCPFCGEPVCYRLVHLTDSAIGLECDLCGAEYYQEPKEGEPVYTCTEYTISPTTPS